MARFSTMAQQAVEAFARSIELPARPANDGSYTFVFQRSGTLSLTPSSDGSRALVSLSRQAARSGDLRLLQRHFANAGIDPTTNTALHAGLTRDGSLVYATSIEEQAFDLPALETCLRRLIERHDMLEMG